MAEGVTPARTHRFSSGPGGILLDLRWRPPRSPFKERLRSLVRRALIGGSDPWSPAERVPQRDFDAAVGMLADGDADAAALAFGRLGYDCRIGLAI